MTFTTLIDVDTVARHLSDASFVIFDCRHDLAKPEWGSEAYGLSHLPDARFAHLDKNLSAPKTGKNGRHPLPKAEDFARWLGLMGVANDTQVVCYDSAGGSYSSRLWWMMRWVGHTRVATMDGGWDAWIDAGRPVTSVVPETRPADFSMRLQPHAAVDAGAVLTNIQTKSFTVVDARANDRFRGQNEIIDPIAGHIPGALNRFFKDNLDAQGRFKSAGVLKAEFESLLAGRPPSQIIHQCGSGVTACHNALAMEIAGMPGSKVYPGSWSEWIADPSRPIATD